MLWKDLMKSLIHDNKATTNDGSSQRALFALTKGEKSNTLRNPTSLWTSHLKNLIPKKI